MYLRHFPIANNRYSKRLRAPPFNLPLASKQIYPTNCNDFQKRCSYFSKIIEEKQISKVAKSILRLINHHLNLQSELVMIKFPILQNTRPSPM